MAPRRQPPRESPEIVSSRRPLPRGLAVPLAIRSSDVPPGRLTNGAQLPRRPACTARRTARRGARRSARGASRLASSPRASAPSEPTGRSGSLLARASARAVATPIRRPVNVPGPDAHGDRVEVAQVAPAAPSTWSIAGSSSAEWPGRPSSAAGSASRSNGSAPFGGQQRDARRVGGGVEAEQRHSIVNTRRSRRSAPGVTRAATRPSSSGSATPGHSTKPIRSGRQVVVEQRGVLAGQRREPVEVEVGDLRRAVAAVDLADREGRAGHRGRRPRARVPRRARRSSCRCRARR